MKGIKIVFENDELLVLDKPSGLAVQGGTGVGASLDALLALERSPPPLLLHRLDKDTSGIIMTAKTKAAAGKFSRLVRSRDFEKHYLALCAGLAPEQGVIRKAIELRGKPKASETRYRRLASGKLPGGGEKNCSLLAIQLVTGRMHQIRRHFAGMGLPLIGDDKYGDFSLNNALRKSCGLKKLLLHAESLILNLSDGVLALHTPPPEYFIRFLDKAGVLYKKQKKDDAPGRLAN